MKKYHWIVLSLLASGCTTQTISSDKVFSNAQVQYETKMEQSALNNKKAQEMPSYFLDLDYEPSQIALNEIQIRKIDSLLQKIVYPEEYKLYVSFGAGADEHQLASLGPILKRAQDIKSKYHDKIKKIDIAYLKNQKPDCVYLRLIT